MKKVSILIAVLFALPHLVFAQRTLVYYIHTTGNFINQYVIKLLFALALVFFLWNVVKYFIIGGANPGEQEKARSLAVWGILAFVIIVCIWGIVTLLVTGTGFNANTPICPDYNPNCTN